jgi:hypothetical protein
MNNSTTRSVAPTKGDSKHTGGIWEVSVDHIVARMEDGTLGNVDEDGQANSIAKLYGPDADDNAVFIVTACNSHASLLVRVEELEKERAEMVLALQKTCALDHREICGCAHNLKEAVMETPEMPPCPLAVAILAARSVLGAKKQEGRTQQ